MRKLWSSHGFIQRSALSDLLGAYCYITSRALLTPVTMELYWHNGLIIVDNSTSRKGDIIRKRLQRLFNRSGFKLDIYTNSKITDYLGVTFTFKKHNQVPSYISTCSNNPKQVYKYISNGITVRFSECSSSHIFTENKHEYETALKNWGYETKLVYKYSGEVVDLYNMHMIAWNILWFMTRYNMAVANRIPR